MSQETKETSPAAVAAAITHSSDETKQKGVKRKLEELQSSDNSSQTQTCTLIHRIQILVDLNA
jgi:hypothetical protein